MLPRPESHGSKLCAGIFLVFVSTSLVNSQTSGSLDVSRHSMISENSTVLNRISQEDSVLPPLASNDGEHKQLPLQSSKNSGNNPEELLKNSSGISELYSKLLRTTSAYYTPTTTVKSLPIIDLKESSTEPNQVTKKYLMEELISKDYPIIKDNKNVDIPEFNEHIDYSEIVDNDKFVDNKKIVTTKIQGDNGIISLLNDTNVNYKELKKEHLDNSMITNNVKIAQKNSTNIIYNESDIDIKTKEPKEQVEIINDVTGSMPMKISQSDEFEKNISSKTTPIPDSTDKNHKISIINNENNSNYEKNEGKTLPKARTISFSEINQFSSTEVKTIGSTKESDEVEFLKEIKPYPYVKSSNTIDSLNSSKIDDSTEESLVLDNKIVKSPDTKKLIVTESSVVIDNSIQQIKPHNIKRSGNLSRIDNSNTSTLSSVTSKTRESIEDKHYSTTELIMSDKTFNIIPTNHDDIIEKKNNLDLSSNGLTENLENNRTILHESRATETNLVQNSTEITEISETVTNKDIQTDAEDSMLLVSSLNITEDSTTTIKPNFTESTTSIPPTTMTIVTDEVIDDTTTDIPETTSNYVTPQSLPPTITTESESFSDSEKETTTSSGVEYEFIGLTESTVSPSYISNSDSSKSIETDITDELTSNSSQITTTISLIDSTTSSIIQNSSTEINNDDMVTILTTKPDESTTMYSITEESVLTTENSLDTTIYTTSVTDTSYPEETTIIQEETTHSDFETSSEFKSNVSTSIDSIDTTIPLIITNATVSPEPSNGTMTTVEIIPVTLSTINSTSITSTESPIDVVTNVQPFAPDDVNLLVRIVIEDTWNSVCPHLSDLRQSLADLLTAGIEKTVLAMQIIFQKNPCMEKLQQNTASTELTLSTLYLYVVDLNGNFDAALTRILPSLYSSSSIKSELTIRSIQLVQDSDTGNAIAVVVVSCVALICLVLLAGLLFIMRKRQTRFNYGERCRPVSLDAFSLDSVSAYNSVRRKGANRASKRSYGNPTFEDSTLIPSHPLNFTGLSTFCNEQNSIYEEFSSIPQISAKIDELPPGAEVKNRYANVIPLPETRVPLLKINNDPLSEYINASYVRGPKNATKYYIACQSPMESTVTDFWRMIWEQQSKVIIMLTDLIENGVEKCAEYIPPSEVTDCHRLYGDYQITLKKRETKEKYAISTIHLKNLENNTYREISHIWYLWPTNGVQTDAAGLIAVLLEARALQRGGPTPIVVHCSPGTGRTGTLIALDLGIRQYEITRTVDVPRVVYTIRRDRAGAVQTKEQYAFIYKALNLYATKLAGGGLEST